MKAMVGFKHNDEFLVHDLGMNIPLPSTGDVISIAKTALIVKWKRFNYSDNTVLIVVDKPLSNLDELLKNSTWTVR